MCPLFDPACAAAVSALEADPFYECITAGFVSDDLRRGALAAYFDYSIRQGTRLGRVVYLETAALGVAVWVLPQSDEVRNQERSRKRTFLRGAVGECGWERYQRIVDCMSARTRTVVDDDAWYLSIVAVAPEA